MEDVIIGFIVWNLFGCIFCLFWAIEKNTYGWELCNPYWTYKYHESVNVFGAIMLSLLYSALCPIGAICYWFYKFCTIGRR